jgi:hypothetical protein
MTPELDAALKEMFGHFEEIRRVGFYEAEKVIAVMGRASAAWESRIKTPAPRMHSMGDSTRRMLVSLKSSLDVETNPAEGLEVAKAVLDAVLSEAL